MPSLRSADANDPPARGKRVSIHIFRHEGGGLVSAPLSDAVRGIVFTPSFMASYPACRRRFGSVSLKSSHVGLYHPRFVTLAR